MPKLFTTLCLMLLAMAASCASTRGYDKPGFVTEVVNGRLWVFEADSEELQEFRTSGEPTKCFQWIGEGPEGMTLRARTKEVLIAYLNS